MTCSARWYRGTRGRLGDRRCAAEFAFAFAAGETAGTRALLRSAA
jgi:hypothetical protein